MLCNDTRYVADSIIQHTYNAILLIKNLRITYY